MSNFYADVEIRILKAENDGYPVEITLNNEQVFAGGILPLTIAEGESSNVPGQRLFEQLQQSAEFNQAWAKIEGLSTQRRIRWRIDKEAPELHAIPWERLQTVDDNGNRLDLAASLATPFSRYLAGTWQPGSPILKRPLKMLVAIANPQGLEKYNLTPIDVTVEAELIQAATAETEIEVTVLTEPCTLTALEAELQKGYHLLHIVAHGRFSTQNNEAALFLADEDNQVELVKGERFATMLARQLSSTETTSEEKLRLVFLASCQTATRSPADAFLGLAPQLVRAGVPAVIAMQDNIPIKTARAFSQTFYESLLEQGQVDVACNTARSHLLTAELAGAAIPVLFMRLREGRLLGYKGQITSTDGQDAEHFWPFLLRQIEEMRCTPFLGAKVNQSLLPTERHVAQQLAAEFAYPFQDDDNLTRVAQYIAIDEPQTLRSRYLDLLAQGLLTALNKKPPTSRRRGRTVQLDLQKLVQGLDWQSEVLALHENELHYLLADIEFPLYMTTNIDLLMEQAIAYKQAQLQQSGEMTSLAPVRTRGLRWEREANAPKYILNPPPDLDHPVVFHLNGFNRDRFDEARLVLSEDDYLAYFANLAHTAEQDWLLPADLLGLISKNTFLFLGYDINDWAFRVLLQGLLKQTIAEAGKRLHVGVQLDIQNATDQQKAKEYLQRYLRDYNISIYWGTTQQFVSELHSRWRAFLKEKS